MKTILLFGVFDTIHEGHQYLFSQAKEKAPYIVIAVAPDVVVKRLKGHPPMRNEAERMALLQKEVLVDEVILGDREEGDYHILETVRPDLIGIGYDQFALAENLRTFLHVHHVQISLVKFSSFHPETFKSSLLSDV